MRKGLTSFRAGGRNGERSLVDRNSRGSMSNLNDSLFDPRSAASTAGRIVLALASLVPPSFARADERAGPSSTDNPNVTERIDRASAIAPTAEATFAQIPAPRGAPSRETAGLAVRAVVGERIITATIPEDSFNLDRAELHTYAVELKAKLATREDNLAILHKLIESTPKPYHRDSQAEMLERYKNGACVEDTEGFLRIDEAGNIVALKDNDVAREGEGRRPHTALFITGESRLDPVILELRGRKTDTYQKVEAIEGSITVRGEPIRVVLTQASLGLSGSEMREYAAQLGGRLGTDQEHDAYLKDLLFKKFDGTLTEAEAAALKMHEENWILHKRDDFGGAQVVSIKDGKLERSSMLQTSSGVAIPLTFGDCEGQKDVGAFIVVPPTK